MITNSFEKEFTTNNLVNSDLLIERVSINTDKVNIGSCLVLDAINNMQEGSYERVARQSPMTCINETYMSDYFNTVIPKNRKWRFSITDKQGNYITLKAPLFVSIHFSIHNRSCFQQQHL